jgi:hypothetical protein
MLCTQSFTQKALLYLYFLTDFNNSDTILTRIVSQFRFSIQNRNLKSADWMASFSKYEIELWLLFGHFWSDFNDLHVILTRIVSRLQTYTQNKNRTIVARTATILVWVIEVYTVTFSVGGGKVLLQRLSTGGPRSDRTKLTSSKSSLLCKCRPFC